LDIRRSIWVVVEIPAAKVSFLRDPIQPDPVPGKMAS